MMGRRSKTALLLYMVFLMVLFLMCSTDLIIREPEKEVYQIAVIIEDIRDDNYGNFKKGMDQAAVEQMCALSRCTKNWTRTSRWN